jgi:hypothetical protein
MPILSTFINATNMNSVIEHLPRSNASRSESEASGTLYMLNEPTYQLSRSESEASGTLYMLNEPTSQLSSSESEASGTLYMLNEPTSVSSRLRRYSRRISAKNNLASFDF